MGCGAGQTLLDSGLTSPSPASDRTNAGARLYDAADCLAATDRPIVQYARQMANTNLVP